MVWMWFNIRCCVSYVDKPPVNIVVFWACKNKIKQVNFFAPILILDGFKVFQNMTVLFVPTRPSRKTLDSDDDYDSLES